MFQLITARLSDILQKLRARARLTPQEVNTVLREIRIALLEADVNYRCVKEFVERIKEEALREEVIEKFTPGQQIVKIVYTKLVEILGGEPSELKFTPSSPTIVLLLGLYGCGKTTSAAKLAYYYKKKGRRVFLIASDTHRPAAREQLIGLAQKIEVPIFTGDTLTSPLQICQIGVDRARAQEAELIVIDTSGAFQIDKSLIEELKEIKDQIEPTERILVVDAMTGQEALNIGQGFDKELELSGILVTKLDSDARGGVVLSLREVIKKPIKFIGVGEKLDALEPFLPERIASRILGMGDILRVIEKVEETIEIEKAKELEKKLRQEGLNLQDFLDQIKWIRKMGGFQEILNLLPFSPKIQNFKINESDIIKFEAIINSMTPEERRFPHIITGSRRARIARGSGTTPQDVNRLLKRYEMASKLFKKLKQGRNFSKFFFKGGLF
jgi:signal recognition particle subunit SRP54